LKGRRKKKQKYRFGNVPTYETRSSIEKRELDEYAWLTAPDPAQRYDSSLSDPGWICPRCRTFVGSPSDRPCPECFLIR
jgi:rubrerythrin